MWKGEASTNILIFVRSSERIRGDFSNFQNHISLKEELGELGMFCLEFDYLRLYKYQKKYSEAANEHSEE